MPTVTFKRSVIENLVGAKLTTEELKDRISMLGTNLETIEGEDIHIEIFPNRPDLLSEQGFARAFASFIGRKTGLRKYNVKPSGEKIIIDKSVARVRPFTSCAIVKGITFDDEKIREVIQVQEKLHITYGRNRKKVAIGIYPLEKIKFPVTFFAEEPSKVKFIPLESSREMTGLQILSQHPTGREYGHLLEGMERFPFFKDAHGRILSMPPIINSHDVGKIAESTSDVFIECSGFDYGVLATCLNMIATALADMGGAVYSLVLKYPDRDIISPNLSPTPMKLDIKYINKRLGMSLTEREAQMLLARMGYGYDTKKKAVLIPPYRADILHTVDLVEDILIAYGYENVRETIPKVATVGSESPLETLKRNMAELLIGLKINELYTYNITNAEAIEKKYYGQKPIMLANSLSLEFNCIRSSMIPSLLVALSKNRHNEYPQHVFDMGTVFTKDQSCETGIREEDWLSVALAEDKMNFTRIKQVLDYLFNNLDVKYELKEAMNPSFMEGRLGQIIVGGKMLGIVGEISPNVLTNFGLEYPIAALELNISELMKLIS